MAMWVLSSPTTGLDAQPVPRAAYLSHLPPLPRIVAQTPASARFHLYGDPSATSYRDDAPADGVDDVRAARLLVLAERFSPILRRNTFLVPRDVWWVLGHRPVLEVDYWLDSRLTATDSIAIDAPGYSSAQAVERLEPSASDIALERLVHDFDPESAHPSIVPAGARATRVLFFDTPGDGERSWRTAFASRGHTGSRIYAHFFVAEASLDQPDRFVLAIQFWFYYPFNDGPNNHEGDWEHINVHITTRASLAALPSDRHAAYLDETDIEAILDGSTPLGELVIGAVDYYYHHHVTTLDYAAVQRHPPAAARHDDSLTHVLVDAAYVAKAIRQRVEGHDGRLATHPIGYIGGNNKGPDELYHVVPRWFWSYNRNSGATYPLPGTWQTIGPLGATETVRGKIVPPREELGDHYLTYAQTDIELLPDWERLVKLVRDDPVVRRRWAWFILPVRWGYPASVSPAAGVVQNVDLGNLSPFGPAFLPSWNRLGANGVHSAYVPRTLRTPISPLVPWSVVQSGWGLFNYPLVITELYPFYNVMSGHLSPWALPVVEALGIELPKTHVSRLPARFATLGAGVSLQRGGDRLARTLLRVAGSDREGPGPRGQHGIEERARSTSTGRRLWLDLHFGNSFYFENSYSVSRPTLRLTHWNASRDSSATLSAVADMHHLTGGIRTGVPWLRIRQPLGVFARVGYGWTWYSLRDVTIDGRASDARVTGGYGPPFLPGRRSWPNLAYTGLTIEYFRPGTTHWFRRLGYGGRVDVGGILQRIPSSEAGGRTDMWLRQGEVAVALTAGW